MTALSRLLCELLRLTVVVTLSAMSGVAVALLSRHVDGLLLEVFAFFMIFATPMIAAWWLLRIIPSAYRAKN